MPSKSVFEEDEAEEAVDSGGRGHPPNVGRGILIFFNSIGCGRLSFRQIFCLEMKANDYSFLTGY